jgi:hypothetical protein
MASLYLKESINFMEALYKSAAGSRVRVVSVLDFWARLMHESMKNK